MTQGKFHGATNISFLKSYIKGTRIRLEHLNPPSAPNTPVMYTITFRIALSVLLVLNSATLITAAARRFNVTDILTKRKTPDNLTCGTTGNAVYLIYLYYITFQILIQTPYRASDCESLLASDWVNLNYGRTCSYQPGGDIVPLTGYNPICSPGNCTSIPKLSIFSPDIDMFFFSRLCICHWEQLEHRRHQSCRQLHHGVQGCRHQPGERTYWFRRRREYICLPVRWRWMQWLLVSPALSLSWYTR